MKRGKFQPKPQQSNHTIESTFSLLSREPLLLFLPIIYTNWQKEREKDIIFFSHWQQNQKLVVLLCS